MPALRNRRLEQLLGGSIAETLTYEQVRSLIPHTAEAPDLDFKRDTYSGTKGKKSVSMDVAAFANAGGGIIILGMDEDDQGRAANDVGVDISDEERRRLRQTVIGNVQPMPVFDIIPVEDPARAGRGFLVISVARSADAPHAYVADNKALVFPKRIGTETIQLSEGEIAQAYRARFAGFTSRIEEAARIESAFTPRLAVDELFVVVTLVPDLPGAFTIDTATVREFELGTINRTITAFGIPARGFIRAGNRQRRLVAAASWDKTKPITGGAAELHENGSGVFATAIGSRPSGTIETPTTKLVDSQWLTLGIGAGLKYLGCHARDRAAAGGLATIRATISPLDQRGVVLMSDLGWPAEQVGSETLYRYNAPIADAVADMDDLCTDGPGLVAATYRLATDLFQAFGAPEVAQLTADGNIRIRYWDQSMHVGMTRWAAAAGVELLTDTLD